MKRILSLILAVVLATSLLSLSSCGGDRLVGKWVAEADIGDLVESATDGGLLDKIDFTFLSGTTIDLVIEFKEDGTFVETFDVDEAKETVKEALDLFLPSIVSKIGGSIDLFLKLIGKSSVDEWIDELFQKIAGESGNYSFENGELRLGKTVISARFDKDALVLEEVISFDEEEGAQIPVKAVPLTFTKKQ